MNIAILGASSQIAQDLILLFSKNKSYDFALFGRNVELLDKWVNSQKLNERYQVQEYSCFNNSQNYDVIVNFVGIGDPVKAKNMGSDIFKVTEKYDDMALDYVKHHKETKYIFLSSGVVYGGSYQEPVNENTIAMLDINNLNTTDWYAMAKSCAEVKHRSLSSLSIVDVRVFNYFSHTQNLDAGFLITDIARAIKNKEIFKMSDIDIIRDFITPPDFYNLIQAIILYKPINIALDCYTKKPVSKFNLVLEVKKIFKMSYVVDKNLTTLNISGHKQKYFSKNKIAESIGYYPNYSSLEGVINEIEKIIYCNEKK